MSISLTLNPGDTGLTYVSTKPDEFFVTNADYQGNLGKGQGRTRLPRKAGDGNRYYDISIQGLTANGSGTVALRRSFDGGVNWGVVKSYTADAEEFGVAAGVALYDIQFTGTVGASKQIRIAVGM